MKRVDWVMVGLYTVLLLWLVSLGLIASERSSSKESMEAQRTTEATLNREIEDLKKEIRLIKTDIDILQNGYERGEK